MASAANVVRGRPSLPQLIHTFAKIGLLSFGGGSSTLVLMQQEWMERTRWLSADDFAFIVAGVAFALVAFTRVDVLLVLAGAGALGLSTLLRGQ
jgi:hypothetical protein